MGNDDAASSDGEGESELYQDVISQFSVLNGYTHIMLGFQLAATTDRDSIVAALQTALDRLTDQIPWLGWQAAKEEESGIMKPVPWPSHVPKDRVHVKDCEGVVPPMAQLLRKVMPFGALDAAVLTPWPGIPVPHGIVGPMPIVALQTNFVDGGVIVTVSAHHNIMDGAGVVQLVRLLGFVLDGRQHEIVAAEFEQANRDRSRVVPLIPRSESVKDHSHLRRPPGFEFRRPSTPSPVRWRYFNLPLTAQSRLVKTASGTSSSSFSSMVSENDVLCAFYWQRLSIVRLARRKQEDMYPETLGKFTRAIDARMALGVPPSYMGHLVYHAVTRLPISQAASLPLGQLAQVLRRDMLAANTPWAVRSYATTLAREREQEVEGSAPRPRLMYAGAQNPDVDVGATSWVVSADRSNGKQQAHALGSWGPLFGAIRFCRPARTAPLSGLFSPLPAENGAVPILVCLSEGDLEGLKKDPVWKQYMKFVG